jgi:hypothetical protein
MALNICVVDAHAYITVSVDVGVFARSNAQTNGLNRTIIREKL